MSEAVVGSDPLNENPGAGEHERLWTPWRMRYVGGGAREHGCIFCNRLSSANDAASLILHRERDAFVIMNLFPYNTAHLMIVPTAHVSSPETTPEPALARLGTLLQPVTRALRRVLSCDGFNVGFNVGAVAGAGVAEHLHQHVVPRWTGDANFMPILAGTMVLPELIPVSYAKVRAELWRELHPPDAEDRDDVQVVATSLAGDVLLRTTDSGLRLPRFRVDPDRPLWRGALQGISRVLVDPELTGWAGTSSTIEDRSPVLRIQSREVTAGNETEFVRVDRSEAVSSLTIDDDRAILTAALESEGG